MKNIPEDNVVTGARFLPFDVFSFIYPIAANDPHGYAPQADQLRRLNAHVLQTVPASNHGIRDLITGMYQPKSVNDPTAVANSACVPTGWSDTPAHQKLYNEVVRPYCRTCHISTEAQALIDWTTFQGFSADAMQIQSYVCQAGTGSVMPQAEWTAEQMWAGPARAHLVAGLGLRTACILPNAYSP